MKLTTGMGLAIMVCLLGACSETTEVVAPPNIDTDLSNDSLATPTEVTLAALNDKIVQDPNNPNTYFERSAFLMELVEKGASSPHHVPLAINDLKRALLIDSTIAAVHYELGNIYYKLSRSEEAMDAYLKAIKFDPSNTGAMIKIAQIYLVYRNHKKVFEYCDKTLKTDAYVAEAYFVKGWAFMETGDTFKAVSSLATAREVNPEYYEANMLLGQLYAEANDERALAYYDAALSTHPKSIEALYAKGLYYQNHDQLDRAIATYNRIVELDPKSPLAQFNLGYCYLIYKKEYPKATTYYTRAIELVPEYYEAFVNRGLAYEEMGDFSNARSDYNKALELKPNYELAIKGLNRLPR